MWNIPIWFRLYTSNTAHPVVKHGEPPSRPPSLLQCRVASGSLGLAFAFAFTCQGYDGMMQCPMDLPRRTIEWPRSASYWTKPNNQNVMWNYHWHFGDGLGNWTGCLVAENYWSGKQQTLTCHVCWTKQSSWLCYSKIKRNVRPPEL